MRTREGYRTRQRAEIEQALRQTEGRHVTVDELTEQLSVGRTTVYRCLERLTAEGLMRKYATDAGACYQYVGENPSCREHFHLKCERCGKLFHVSCEHLQELQEHIRADHGFRIDPMKTVFYGICEDCDTL